MMNPDTKLQVCTGCGSARLDVELRRHPTALSCCPERQLTDVTLSWRYLRALVLAPYGNTLMQQDDNPLIDTLRAGLKRLQDFTPMIRDGNVVYAENQRGDTITLGECYDANTAAMLFLMVKHGEAVLSHLEAQEEEAARKAVENAELKQQLKEMQAYA